MKPTSMISLFTNTNYFDMKKLSILLFTTLLICFATTANAQIKFGIKGALNFNDTKSVRLDDRAGWQAGVMARFNLPIVGIGVQPEILYTHKRAKISYEGTDTRETVNSSYLQIPVNAIWTFGLGKIGVFVTGGPYFSYAVDFDKAIKNAVDKFDWGLGLGAGLDISKIHAGVRYDWGLQNIAKESDQNIKNKAFTIFVGFFF